MIGLMDLTWFVVAVARKEDDPEGAIVEFQTIVDGEEEKGEW